jgi:hypothetical protein
MRSAFSLRQACASLVVRHIQPRSSRSLILPSLVFSSGVRDMNCHSINDNATIRFIMKVCHDFRPTMIRSNRWGAFLALELEFYVKSVPYRLLFDEIKLREPRAFRSCGPLTFPWTSYRADDVLHGSVGSTSLSEST